MSSHSGAGEAGSVDNQAEKLKKNRERGGCVYQDASYRGVGQLGPWKTKLRIYREPSGSSTASG